MLRNNDYLFKTTFPLVIVVMVACSLVTHSFSFVFHYQECHASCSEEGNERECSLCYLAVQTSTPSFFLTPVTENLNPVYFLAGHSGYAITKRAIPVIKIRAPPFFFLFS